MKRNDNFFLISPKKWRCNRYAAKVKKANKWSCAVWHNWIPLLVWCSQVFRVVCKYSRTAVEQLAATTGSARTSAWRGRSGESTTCCPSDLRCSYERRSSATWTCALCRLLTSLRSRRSRCRTASRLTCMSLRLQSLADRRPHCGKMPGRPWVWGFP